MGNSVGLQTVQVREWMETRIFHFEIPIRDLKVIKPHSRRSVGLGGSCNGGDAFVLVRMAIKSDHLRFLFRNILV